MRDEPSDGRAMSATARVAITVWGKRLSPVFDAAGTLLLVELLDREVVGCRQLQFAPGKTEEVIRLLRACDVEVLLCGAISDGHATKLEQAGIRLISFISGKVDQVLCWYVGGMSMAEYHMPGCHEQGPQSGGRCRRGRMSPNRLGRIETKNTTGG